MYDEVEIDRADTEVIQGINTKISAVSEVLARIAPESPIVDSLIDKIGDLTTKKQKWFALFEQRYGAVGRPGWSWAVDFDRSVVRLVPPPTHESYRQAAGAPT